MRWLISKRQLLNLAATVSWDSKELSCSEIRTGRFSLLVWDCSKLLLRKNKLCNIRWSRGTQPHENHTSDISQVSYDCSSSHVTVDGANKRSKRFNKVGLLKIVSRFWPRKTRNYWKDTHLILFFVRKTRTQGTLGLGFRSTRGWYDIIRMPPEASREDLSGAHVLLFMIFVSNQKMLEQLCMLGCQTSEPTVKLTSFIVAR